MSLTLELYKKNKIVFDKERNLVFQSIINHNHDEKYIICRLEISYDVDCPDLPETSDVNNDNDNDDDIDDDNDDDSEPKSLYTQFLNNRYERMSPRYVLVSTALPYHSHIMSWYESHLESLAKYFNQSSGGTLKLRYKAKCLGGGIMTINHSQKTLKTYGTSYGYGAPDINTVREILNRTNQCNYLLDVTITDEIRG
ncbi:hypothetical protein SAMD00019534_077650 [Acytostelium subglobosum LB1]|uniref:hypothetical protein n=1 Tax=Acytostelium subglobosum LB1 TaxID=1410327 RepID=UPI000644F26B|nr:hypothetical protein SAMD00019534_077650 [Acytostelium subglobosum LB1]GAM24590.1 hypothetical protein SAMD00019534_077650 [Acytostelium subglobosum LB1]|eukprot:XP_012752259.1 hypothetical protein SAMD00019534_077650 [Acytostelium subglobosum LB1]